MQLPAVLLPGFAIRKLIAKPGSKTAASLRDDPYIIFKIVGIV